MGAGQADWRIRNFGARWQFGLFHALIRLAGRKATYLLADLVSLHYTLASPAVRRRCRPYLEHRFPGRRGWARLMDTFRLVRTFARMLVDQAALRILGETGQTRFGACGPLNALLAEGKGLIIVTAHVGAWHLGLEGLAALERPVSTLARFEEEDRSSPFHVLGRNHLIDPEGFLGGVPEMMAVLQRGEVLCLMGDRAFGEGSTVPVPFLGGPVHLPYAAYKLASATGAKVAVLFPYKPGHDQYEMMMAGSFEVPPGLGRDPLAYQPYAARFALMLEQFLVPCPYHFFNFFNLWDD